MVPPNPVKLTADADLISRVIQNLLANALNSRPNQVRSIWPSNRTTSLVRVSVQDSGPGIPAEYQERVFDKFFQVEAGSKDRSIRRVWGSPFASLR